MCVLLTEGLYVELFTGQSNSWSVSPSLSHLSLLLSLLPPSIPLSLPPLLVYCSPLLSLTSTPLGEASACGDGGWEQSNAVPSVDDDS